MGTSYNQGELFAAIEAYSASMGDSYGHERVGADMADELLDVVNSGGAFADQDYDASYSDAGDPMDEDDEYPVPLLSEAPFAVKLSLPAPTVMAPKTLFTRLLRDISFPESFAVFKILDSCNADLFSCMPANEHLYEDSKLLSQRPLEVLEAAEAAVRDAPRTFTTAVDLHAHGDVKLPEVPDAAEDLPKYISDVQTFFLSELEAREKAYHKLFMGYCAAIALYIRREAAHESRGLRVENKEAEVRKRTRKGIVTKYYREAARVAKTLYAHMYLSVCREASRRLAATQVKKKDVFVQLKYEWKGHRQFNCMFHPVIQNHGVSTIDGIPVTAKAMRNLNDIRTKLGLYPVRFGLLEVPGEKITEPAEFSPSEPRSSGFLTQKILQKLGAYEKKHRAGARDAAVITDHPYARRVDAPNYGSTVECMLDYPDPDTVLPCDPYVPPCVSVSS